MNGEEMYEKTFAEVEQAVAEAKKNLPKPAVIVFKPPVTSPGFKITIFYFIMRCQKAIESEPGEDKIPAEVHPE